MTNPIYTRLHRAHLEEFGYLFNCTERLSAEPLRIIEAFAARLGLSPARLRLWTFARAAAEPRERWEGDAWFEVARKIAP